jgi:superfamily II RNA helicase
MERRRNLQLEKHDIVARNFDAVVDQAEPKVADTDTWTAALQILKTLEKVDAFSIIETHGAYIKLKPLGMLISRLHNAENELWIAAVVMSNHVRQLSPSEFIGILATVESLDPEVENLFSNQRELLYRVPKPLKDAFVDLGALRNQIAALQGSYDPPLHFDTALAGMVYAWARAKPGTNGFSLVKTNIDGAVARKLRVISKLANLIYEACTQVSVDMSEPSDFNSLSSLARKAEDLLTRHVISVE